MKNKLIATLREELYSKRSPSEVLNNITEAKLIEFLKQYPCNEEALWIGSYLADLFITEARVRGDIKLHVPMALEYAKKIFEREQIPVTEQQIIIELIATHHGGKQKYLESKLYKNADCYKFLLLKGQLDLFPIFYDGSEISYQQAVEYIVSKIQEKYRLADLNNEIKADAKRLYQESVAFWSSAGGIFTKP